MSMNAIKTYLEPDLAREVARVARAQGRSESSFIAEAVRTRLAGGSEAAGAAAAETTKRQLSRLEARIDRIQRDQAMVKECLFVFVRVWLEHNPPIDERLADSIAASAGARFERFLDLAAQGLQPGRSMGDLGGELASAFAGKAEGQLENGQAAAPAEASR